MPKTPLTANRVAKTGRIALGLMWFASTWALAAPASISLPRERAFPESLSSTQDGTLYVGNLAEGGVVRIKPKAAPEVWIKPGAFGSASILGVLADEPSKRWQSLLQSLRRRGFVPH